MSGGLLPPPPRQCPGACPSSSVGRIPCSAEKGFAQFVDRFVNVAGEGGSRKALGSLLSFVLKGALC